MSYEFLSPAWIDAVQALRHELPESATDLKLSLRLNLVVTETPWGESVDAHVDSSSGPLVVDLGHLEEPDLQITVDYATAKALLVDGNPQAAMTAFMAGKIQVDGDMSKLMALQGSSPDPETLAFSERIRDLTS